MNVDGGLIPLGSGVYALRADHIEGWCGLLVGGRRTLVIDAGRDAAEGRRLVRVAQDFGRPADLLAYTHGHWDHVRGGVAFADAEVVAHRDALPMTHRELAVARASDESLGDADRDAGTPTVIVAGETTFDLGGLVAHWIPTPGHSPGACSLHVPSVSALFTGDTVVTAIPPAFADGDSATLESTLRDLGRLGSDILVPGHGPILRGSAPIAEWTGWMADYLARVRDHAAGLIGKESADGIVARTEYADFVGDRLPRDRYDMVVRHERAVRTIVGELERGGRLATRAPEQLRS